MKHLLISATLLATAGSPAVSAYDSPKLTDEQILSVLNRMTDQHIEGLIDAYVQKHPDRIMASVSRYQRQQQMASLSHGASTYREHLETTDRLTLGNPEGSVAFVEFIDYRCGFCRRHHQVMKQLMAEFPQIKFLPKILYTLDRDGEPPVSEFAARAAYAAAIQDRFPEYHEAMLAHEGGFGSTDDVLAVAETAGLDVERLRVDVDSEEVSRQLMEIRAISEEAGFWQMGTPGFLINGEAWVGADPIEHFRLMVQDAIKGPNTGR